MLHVSETQEELDRQIKRAKIEYDVAHSKQVVVEKRQQILATKLTLVKASDRIKTLQAELEAEEMKIIESEEQLAELS